MSRSRRIPKHTHPKGSNCGVVRLNGVDHYTAKWGSPDAEAEYERLIARWLADGRSLPAERNWGTWSRRSRSWPWPTPGCT